MEPEVKKMLGDPMLFQIEVDQRVHDARKLLPDSRADANKSALTGRQDGPAHVA
jgi:hypothetical protein